MHKTTAVATLAISLTCIFGATAIWSLDGQSDRLATLDARVAELGQRLGAAVATPVPVEPGLEALAARIERMESRLDRRAVEEAVAAVDAADPNKQTTPASHAQDTAAATHARGAELLAEVTAPDFDWATGGEKLGEFIRLAREGGFLQGLIDGLEEQVEASPDATDARMDLASAYIGKLLTVQGPEQGVWGSKAEKQWHTVRELDPDHWESRFRIGNSYAYYPDVMGKTDDAIAMLEEARQIQERRAPAPEHVQTYLFLARMHQRSGDDDRAREVLESGLTFHPGDAPLRQALDGIK